MTLKLENGTDGKVEISTDFNSHTGLFIRVGKADALISAEDMVCLVSYWLTNTPTKRNDIRAKFLRELKKAKLVKSHESGWLKHYHIDIGEGWKWWKDASNNRI